MAQIHVSKDPSNQLSLPFFNDLLNHKTRSGCSHNKKEIILQYPNNLKNDMIYK